MTEETLFELALQTPTANRASLLDRACAGDPALRSRVEALLAADAAEAPPPEVGFAITADAAPGTATYDLSGTRSHQHSEPVGEAGQLIGGKYKLIEAIGEGGMGTVWMAQQTEPVKRAVAVKLIKEGMDSKAVLARFEAERQALAMMDHPNIAKILDGGLHDGRPYFVMELVKGIPITQFCDARKLTPNARLELFVQVCNATQHAHQKGVIHRDIKPSNVLVALFDDRPVPKVIDFGVAKATGAQLTDRTLMTGFGAVVGTPEYMSPEQASFNQMDVDTRSDIYALGVLLYELLTGTTPVDRKSLGKAALLEILRIVREVEAPRPSAKLSTSDALPSISANRGIEPKKLTGLMRNELDWIVMKALEKDRTRRYDTANGFAADVQRYLAGEAVLAHPPTLAYRLRKAYRKNRGPVLASSLVVLVLLAGIAGTTWGLVRAEERRGEADRARTNEGDQRRLAESATADARTAELGVRTVFEATVDDLIDKKIFGSDSATIQPLPNDERPYHERLRDYFRRYAADLPDGPERTAARLRYAKVCTRLTDERGTSEAFEAIVADARRAAADAPGVDSRHRLVEALTQYRSALDYIATVRGLGFTAATYPPMRALAGGLAGFEPTDAAKRARADAITDELISTLNALARDEAGVAYWLKVATLHFRRAAAYGALVQRSTDRLSVTLHDSQLPLTQVELAIYGRDLHSGVAAYRAVFERAPTDPAVLAAANESMRSGLLKQAIGLLDRLPDDAVVAFVHDLFAFRIALFVAAGDRVESGSARMDIHFTYALDELAYRLSGATEGRGDAAHYRKLLIDPIDRAVRERPDCKYGPALSVIVRMRGPVDWYREGLTIAASVDLPSPDGREIPLRDYLRQTRINELNRSRFPRDWDEADRELLAWLKEVEAVKPKPDLARLKALCGVHLQRANRFSLVAGPELVRRQNEEALEAIRFFERISPDLDENDGLRSAFGAWYNRAAAAVKARDPKEAVRFHSAYIESLRKSIREQLKLEPALLKPLQQRGELYLELKQYAQAVEDFTAALAIAPDPVVVVITQEGPTRLPQDGPLNFLCGTAYFRRGKFEDADKMFERGFASSRAFADGKGVLADRYELLKALTDCAQAYDGAGRLEDASKWFGRAAVQLRAYSKVYSNAGLSNSIAYARAICRPSAGVLYRLGKTAEAVKAIDDLLDLLSPADAPMAKMLRARCTARLGDHSAASKAAKDLVAAAGPTAGYQFVFDAASCFAFCTGASKEMAEKEKYGDEAIRLLRNCAKSDPKLLATQLAFGDFNSLRKREDFKTLKADLEKQVPQK